MPDSVSIIPSYAVNHEKWDECIARSPNALIYASADYLDHIADNWTGVVLNDYEAVMPIPWRRKFGIRYCYDVPFMQQLGMFSSSDGIVMDAFVPILNTFCQYGDYHFNFANNIASGVSHNNFVISLNQNFDSMLADFSKDVQKNIKRSKMFNNEYVPASVSEAVDTYKEVYRRRIGDTTSRQFANFKTVCRILEGRGGAVVRKVVSPGGKLLSIVLMLKDRQRLYNLMNSTLPDGRDSEANYFLLQNVFAEFQHSGLLFDFEGSDLPGVRSFYEKFNPVNQPFSSVHINNLPWPLKLWKK